MDVGRNDLVENVWLTVPGDEIRVVIAVEDRIIGATHVVAIR